MINTPSGRRIQWNIQKIMNGKIYIIMMLLLLSALLYYNNYNIFAILRAGSQVFSLIMLFLCVILYTMWSDKSLQFLCILPFGMLCLSAISMLFVKIMLAGMVV